eukprot:22772-Lingulodinium_polyedra.AAC.1
MSARGGAGRPAHGGGLLAARDCGLPPGGAVQEDDHGQLTPNRLAEQLASMRPEAPCFEHRSGQAQAPRAPLCAA